ncbi:RagB/SusD family nutrient uptake outer membrane protein [Foetidibacter luteolus]|uniref:RagB/SusD family nutrient uptake outer membrane protein n=1 Tax=Foetidibacter luteolus TaxID=2608880 RepID=UPI001A980EAB|nr:RagB/SusD family nutrient uptake outer membrane protein [Foetidibacter luteolus]
MGLLFMASCTNLDEREELYDTVTSDNFYKTDEELVAALGAAYTNLYGTFGNADNIMPLQEVTTDEMVVPTRGPDWGDGGHWVRLKKHIYKADDPRPTGTWERLYKGVNTCNRLLATLEPLGTDASKKYVSELKALRAIYFYWLLDLYGNVPITTDFANTEPPANNTRNEVYEFVEKELLENIPSLQKTGPNNGETYGRVNYYTAYATLAKLYLNAQVYTGTPQWDKAIAACDEIINSGQYALMANYADNFKKENKGSTEFIWVIPYDEIKATGFTTPLITLHPAQQSAYSLGLQPWNGFASVQEFYQSYIDPAQNPGPKGLVVGVGLNGDMDSGTVDKRLSNFIVGPQYQADGVTPLLDAASDDPGGNPLVFTPYMNELEPAAWRQSGARIGKWEIYKGGTGNLSNDYCIFRYADILLTKAEALARKNGWGDAVALALVNQIRTTHGGVDPYASLDANKFLAERGREMFAETTRRQDLIRFGKYNDAYRFHAADPVDNLGPNGINHLNVFPIPATQLNANKNLKQNPGY